MSHVLWLEDQITKDLVDMYSRATTDGHDVDVVRDVTSVLDRIQETEYDFLIVDIRVLPGASKPWYDYYQEKCSATKDVARLGLELLRFLFRKSPQVRMDGYERPHWLTTSKVGVLSVETYAEPDLVKDEMRQIGIPAGHYMDKTAPGDPSPRLSMLIEALIRSNTPSEIR